MQVSSVTALLSVFNQNFSHSSSPLPIRLINLFGHHLAGDARSLIPLEAEALKAQAMRATGLQDWGQDTQFLEGFEVLLKSLNGEAELNTIGRGMMREYMLRLLSNRLKIERDLKAHPEIEAAEIRRPLFIVGFPRTGSTLLQRLLARDPDARSLQTWEMLFPSPAPEEATYYTDRRIKIADRQLKKLNWMAPDLAVAHEIVAGEPEECISLLQTTFSSFAFEILARMPTYRDWLATQDHRIAYRHYKKQLQLLQWKYRKNHWVLKSPFHLLAVDALMDVFPDAVIVQTHRDPVKVLPSMCSLFNVMHQLTSDRADPKLLGPSMVDLLGRANNRGAELRERYSDDRFIDVSYREMVADPIGTVRRIGNEYGRPYSDSALQIMKNWVDSNPQHKRGVHQYTLEEFGLSEGIVNDRFGMYSERFKDYI